MSEFNISILLIALAAFTHQHDFYPYGTTACGQNQIEISGECLNCPENQMPDALKKNCVAGDSIKCLNFTEECSRFFIEEQNYAADNIRGFCPSNTFVFTSPGIAGLKLECSPGNTYRVTITDVSGTPQ